MIFAVYQLEHEVQIVERRHRIGILAGAITLLLLNIGSYSNDFIRFNLQQGVEFLFSSHFLFFAVSGMILLYKKLSSRVYGTAVFAIAFIYEFLYYGRNLGLSSMEGDNICQIAYWNILLRPNLAGSLGSSVTKPGQLVIAGLLNQAGTEFGLLFMQVGLCLVMAVAVWSLVMIASEFGGRFAGVLAFPLVSSYMLVHEFVRNSYSIYLVPVLFLGIWLYFYHPKRRGTGRVLLTGSILFHAQALPVVGIVLFVLLIRKDWQEFARFSACILVVLAIWMIVVLRVQGSLERIYGGPAVGYLTYGPQYGDSSIASRFAYIVDTVSETLRDVHQMRFLFALMFIGILGTICYGNKWYLAVFSSLLLLVLNVLLLSGTINLGRFFIIFYAFGCTIGVGTVVRFARETMQGRSLRDILLLGVTLLLLVATADLSMFNLHKDFHYTAVNKLNINLNFAAATRAFENLPPMTRLLTEDAFLYSIIATEPDRFNCLAALQYFNVSPVTKRQSILARTDYILISVKGEHGGYYMQNLDRPEWRTDPFRLMVLGMLSSSEPQNLYGYRFIPVGLNESRLLLKVEPEKV